MLKSSICFCQLLNNNANFGWYVHLAMQSIVSFVLSFEDDLHLKNNRSVGPINNKQHIHIIAYPNVIGTPTGRFQVFLVHNASKVERLKGRLS